MTKAAKELREEAFITNSNFAGDHVVGDYHFTPEQLDAYEGQLCREQREVCMQQIAEHPNAIRKLRHLLRNVRNAPKPETK